MPLIAWHKIFSGNLRDDRTSSFVIAANDTHQDYNSYADYVCDGTNDEVEIIAALNRLPSGGGRVTMLPGTYNIQTSDFTIAAGDELDFVPGAQLNIDAGRTVTFNGGINARLNQIFSMTGTVTINSNSVDYVYPQWWGATQDGTTDDSTAIQAAIDTGRHIFFPGGSTRFRYTAIDFNQIEQRVTFAGNAELEPLTTGSVVTVSGLQTQIDGLRIEIAGGLAVTTVVTVSSTHNRFFNWYIQGPSAEVFINFESGAFIQKLRSIRLRGFSGLPKTVNSVGIVLGHQAHEVLIEGSFIGHLETGIRIDQQCDQPTLVGSAIENCTTGILKTGTDECRNLTIVGCHFERNDTITYAIRCNGGDLSGGFIAGTWFSCNTVFRVDTNGRMTEGFVVTGCIGSSTATIWDLDALGGIIEGPFDFNNHWRNGVIRSGADGSKVVRFYSTNVSGRDFIIDSPQRNYVLMNSNRIYSSTGLLTFSDGDTTPTVGNAQISGLNWRTNNTGPTTITDFDDGLAGQTITIIFSDNNTTIQNNATISLSNGVDLVGVANNVVTLYNYNSVWYEASRSGSTSSARGNATVLEGNTTIVVAHGLSGSPSVVIATPRLDTRFWITGVDGTNFTINIPTPSPVGGTAFDWKAEV